MSELNHISKETVETSKQPVAEALDNMRAGKQKAIKGFINNKGLFVGIILVFIVILVFTTNVNFTSTAELIKLSLVVFVFMFCSYSMYVNCADSGTRAGRNTKTYIDTTTEYNTIKKRITDKGGEIRLAEFCANYKETELKGTRKDLLDSVGISYEIYMEKYVGLDKQSIKNQSGLSAACVNAIIKANAVKPVKLSPEMIMKRGRGNKRRAPLGTRPETVKFVNYGVKLATTITTSLFTCMLVLEAIANPSWATIAELFVKILMVVLSGFTGYKMGYENITINTVNYTLDQIDLLKQFEQYLKNNPVAPKENDSVEATNETVIEQAENVA